MRIQLKQNEIEAALKAYIASQGIVVNNKDINMVFTSGRKDNGLSVEIVIEEAVLLVPQNDPTPLPAIAINTVAPFNVEIAANPASPEEAQPISPANDKPAGEGDPQEAAPTLTAKSLFG